jgi:hypothetical protein
MKKKRYIKRKGRNFLNIQPNSYYPSAVVVHKMKAPKGFYWVRTPRNKNELISYYILNKHYVEF